jgi:uncharacterized membrane protein YqjE
MTGESDSDHSASDHERPPHEESPGGYAHVIRGLFVSVIQAARTRLDLATVEAEIFLLRIIQMLLWAFAAVACALLALAFAIVAVVAALWDTHRMVGVLGGAGVFVILAAVFGYVASRSLRGRPSMLEGTLAQLETDAHRAGGNQ